MVVECYSLGAPLTYCIKSVKTTASTGHCSVRTIHYSDPQEVVPSCTANKSASRTTWCCCPLTALCPSHTNRHSILFSFVSTPYIMLLPDMGICPRVLGMGIDRTTLVQSGWAKIGQCIYYGIAWYGSLPKGPWDWYWLNRTSRINRTTNKPMCILCYCLIWEFARGSMGLVLT